MIAYDVADQVATITLDRAAELNTYNIALKDALMAAFDRADADDDVRVVVVTGSGKAFCAGMDLSPGPQTFARLDEPEADRLRDSGGELAVRIFNCTKPVIAAINGAAVGIGVTMTLPMDIRLASDRARFGFVFAQRGIVLESCSTWFLPRVVGVSQALEWSFTGRVFDAAEALRTGLVSAVHPPEELLPAAYSLAAQIKQASPVSVALNRQMVWRMLGEPHPMAANIVESRAMYLRGLSPDSTEGVASFFDRRDAAFTGTVPADLPDVFPGRVEPPFTT
ncbi:MAG: enoyl-CoA hydratase [Actinomycetota bacterium]|nr:MAG: enoyl-CoA hydratase [Actinomycetota bacterium]